MILTLSFIFTYTLLKWRSLRRTSRGSSIYLGMIHRCLHLLVPATYMQPQYLVQEPWWEKSTRFLYTKRRIQRFHLSSMLLRLTWLNSWMNRQHSVKMVSFLVIIIIINCNAKVPCSNLNDIMGVFGEATLRNIGFNNEFNIQFDRILIY